jgi:hypothetical protein
MGFPAFPAQALAKAVVNTQVALQGATATAGDLPALAGHFVPVAAVVATLNQLQAAASLLAPNMRAIADMVPGFGEVGCHPSRPLLDLHRCMCVRYPISSGVSTTEAHVRMVKLRLALARCPLWCRSPLTPLASSRLCPTRRPAQQP